MERGQITTTIEEAGFWAIRLLIVFLGVGLLLHFLLWWGQILALSLIVEFFPLSLLFLPLSMVLGIVLHEGLHGLIIALLAPGGWKAVKFGFLNWMTPYCHCQQPITARGYRMVLLGPVVVQGLLPWVLGLITGIIELTLWGAVFISSGSGDLLIWSRSREVPGEEFLQDHPRRVGVLIGKGGGSYGD